LLTIRPQLVCDDCQALLQEEYERLLLEATSGPDAGARPDDDAVRTYMGQALPGSQARPEFVEEFVAFVRARPYGHQTLLDDIMGTLRGFAPRIAQTDTGRIDADVCVAAFDFPVGSFNAQVRPVRDIGFIILANRGVLTLLSHVTRLIGHTTRISGGSIQFLDRARIGVRNAQLPQALAEVIAYYLGYPVRMAGAVPDLGEPDAERMDRLFCACVTFLVAHEYAHALAGHFDDPEAADSLSTGMSGHEVEADWLAAKLLLAPWRYKTLDDDPGNTGLQTLLAGPLLFFALEDVIAEAERRQDGRPPAHETLSGIAPPPVRHAMMKEYYRAVFGKSTFPLSDFYVEWVSHMRLEVLEEVDRIRESRSKFRSSSAD
jgi:hypothetical protein